jgi:hypothetical protein
MLPSERTFSGSSWSPSTSRNDRAAGAGGRILSGFLDPLDRLSASSNSRALLVFDCRHCYFLMVVFGGIGMGLV